MILIEFFDQRKQSTDASEKIHLSLQSIPFSAVIVIFQEYCPSILAISPWCVRPEEPATHALPDERIRKK